MCSSWSECAHPERGVILLETVISAALTLLLTAAAAAVLASTVRTSTSAYKAARDAYTLVRARGLLQRAADDADQSRIAPAPRVHTGGVVTFSDGTPNGVMSAAPRLRPMPGADALTSVRLALLRTQIIVTGEGSAGRLSAYVCPRFGAALARDADRTFIVLGPDGLAEVTGKARQHPGRKECSDITIQLEAGMLAGTPEVDLRFAHMLAPIEALYTVYLSAEGELRLVSHRGRSNVENQPIAKDVQMLSFRTKGGGFGDPLRLHAVLTPKDAPPREIQAGSHLARIPHLSFLLNAP